MTEWEFSPPATTITSSPSRSICFSASMTVPVAFPGIASPSVTRTFRATFGTSRLTPSHFRNSFLRRAYSVPSRNRVVGSCYRVKRHISANILVQDEIGIVMIRMPVIVDCKKRVAAILYAFLIISVKMIPVDYYPLGTPDPRLSAMSLSHHQPNPVFPGCE